jgi:hypothetical protein
LLFVLALGFFFYATNPYIRMMSDSLEEIIPNVLKFFSSRLEMEEAVQSRFLAVAPTLRDAVGALDPATLAVALELAVILFLPMAMRKLLKQ